MGGDGRAFYGTRHPHDNKARDVRAGMVPERAAINVMPLGDLLHCRGLLRHYQISDLFSEQF